MLDGMMFGSTPIAPPNEGTEVKRTAGGVSVVDDSNASPRLLGPAGITKGLSLNSSDDPDNVWTGRLSLSAVGLGLVGLTALYIWTRNVQGGG